MMKHSFYSQTPPIIIKIAIIDNMSRSNEQVHIQWRTYILSSLNYYVGPFAASKNNQQGQKVHEQGVGVESLTMGQTLIPFPPGLSRVIFLYVYMYFCCFLS
jgi:hypothetical protein